MMNGKSPSLLNNIYDAHMRGCIEGLKKNPELIILYDLESGFPYLATKEYQKSLIDFWESFKPKDNPDTKRVIIMFGTGGNLESSNKDWEKIFKNPKDE